MQTVEIADEGAALLYMLACRRANRLQFSPPASMLDGMGGEWTVGMRFAQEVDEQDMLVLSYQSNVLKSQAAKTELRSLRNELGAALNEDKSIAVMDGIDKETRHELEARNKKRIAELEKRIKDTEPRADSSKVYEYHFEDGPIGAQLHPKKVVVREG